MTDKNQKAMLTHSSIPPVSGDTPRLDIFLCYVHTHLGEDVQGLAFATNEALCHADQWAKIRSDKGVRAASVGTGGTAQ